MALTDREKSDARTARMKAYRLKEELDRRWSARRFLRNREWFERMVG